MFHLSRSAASLNAAALGLVLFVAFVAAPQASLAAVAGPVGAVPAAPLPVPIRLAGADRYEQAVLAAQAAFTTSDTVFVASGEKFPDALSAVSVAAQNDAALLLTPAAALLPTVGDEIAALRPSVVVVVGGPASVSDAVLEQLSRRVRQAIVLRIGGADRFAVSRALIADASVGFGTADEIFVANGGGFADALTASPAAAAGARVHPVLLVDGAEPAPSAEETMVITGLGARSAHLVGGLHSIGAALESSLRTGGLGGRRFAGADRFEVGVLVNQQAFGSARVVYLASGLVFPDALSGGALAAHEKAPLYVVPQNCVPQPVLDELVRLAPSTIVVLGGPATLGPGVDALTPCA